MKLQKIICLSALALTVSTKFIYAQKSEKMDSKKQVKQVVELLKAIETGASEPVAVINPNFIQHNLGAEDGFAGFGKLLGQLPPNSAKVNTVRVFQDRDYVFAHIDIN